MAGPKAPPGERFHIQGRGGKRAIACNKCGGLFRGRRSFEEHWDRKHADPTDGSKP